MSLHTGLDMEELVLAVVTVLLLLFSAIVHEVAHGWVALRCGDATAKEAGRLTLNPKAHLDPFGSVVLPLMMALLGGPVFSYAKPVPYDPRRLRNPRVDEVLVALAGPASNLLQAAAGALLFRLTEAQLPTLLAHGVPTAVLWAVLRVLYLYVTVNLYLCFFNLVPLPPLDGSKVVLLFLRGRARRRYYEVQRYSMPLLLVVMYLLPTVLGLDLLGLYFDATVYPLRSALLGLGL